MECKPYSTDYIEGLATRGQFFYSHKTRMHLPDNSPIEQGEYEVKHNGTPGDKMVYPCPEMSL